MHLWVWLVLGAVSVPVAGVFYQWIGGYRDARRFMRHGRLVKLADGRRIYLSESPAEDGNSGPTVIFESGIAATSQNWTGMQASVSRFAHSITYDRSGLGWSSAADCERTPANIVRELHALLAAANISAPYILVGHSFGGMVVRRFALEYPDEVAGVVLVDAMRCSDWPPLNKSRRPMLERGLKLTAIGVTVAQFGLARLAITSLLCRSGTVSRFLSRAAGEGGLHVLDRVTCEVGKMPREVWPIVAAHWSTPHFYRGLSAHLHAVPGTVLEMENADPIEDIPVVILTAATAEPLSTEEVRRIGSRACQVMAERSGHWVHLDEPELVTEEIREMFEQVMCSGAATAGSARYR